MTVLLLGHQVAFGDQIILRNGRTLDCTILSVQAEYVEVSLGTGTVKIPKNRLERLVRTPDRKTADLSEPTSGNILSEQHAPPAHAELAAEFRQLMNQRNAALDAQYMMNLYESQIQQENLRAEQLLAKLKQMHLMIESTVNAIKAIQIPAQTPRTHREYDEKNALMQKKSALRDRLIELNAAMSGLQAERSETEKKNGDLQQKINKTIAPLPIYFNAVEQFGIRYAAYRKALSPDSIDQPARLLFDKIDYYMARFRNETSRVVIDSWNEDNTTFVRALVNGNTPGVFIFDTGATSMVISEPFARKIGLQLDHLPLQQATVADGRKVDMRPVILSSVKVGDAEVKDITAAVLGNGINSRADGLLGMSFLRHFTIGMNGRSGKVTLTRFSTD
ncbi:retropepsin-like aspartic protease [Pontiella agarivorans]|uniref:retropepsin-like aspartic protease n=1 Tax=Pontiella agarivorans TaxID=3038953 RepID=UPI002AD2CEEB|nr:retropepsin-like aspartic protease [Pontiella agarivorans]